jgi:hypothetical protein
VQRPPTTAPARIALRILIPHLTPAKDAPDQGQFLGLGCVFRSRDYETQMAEHYLPFNSRIPPAETMVLEKSRHAGLLAKIEYSLITVRDHDLIHFRNVFATDIDDAA